MADLAVFIGQQDAVLLERGFLLLQIGLVLAGETGVFWTYRRYVYADPMSHTKKLPPQVLYPLLQRQVAELCSQDAVDIMHLLDLLIALAMCEAEMNIDRRPS